MSAGDTCRISWTLNATGVLTKSYKVGVLFNSSIAGLQNHTDNATVRIKPGDLKVELITPTPNTLTKILQNSTFEVEANVTCLNAPCGGIYGSLRYNSSSPYPDTLVDVSKEEKPFYAFDSKLPAAFPSVIGSTTVGDPFYSNQRVICRDEKNYIHVVWKYSYSKIYYARSTDNGKTWQINQSFYGASSTLDSWKKWPSISCDGNNITVAYVDGDAWDLIVAISTDNGETWTWKKVVDGSSDDYPASFALVERRGEKIYVVYRRDWSFGGYMYGDIMFINSTDGGKTWGSPKALMGATENTAFEYPSFVVDGNGGANDKIYVVSFYSYDGYVYFINSTDSGVTWGPKKKITKGIYPSITFNSSNLYVTSSERIVENEYYIYFANSTDYGNTWTNYTLHSVTDYPFPSVTVDSQGYPVVFWQQNDTQSSGFNIVYKKYNGTSWSPVRYVTMDILKNNEAVNTKYKSDGKIEFVWVEENSVINYMKLDSNPQSCNFLSKGQSCLLTWIVNATGNTKTYWKIDVKFNSTAGTENDTQDAIIKIVWPYLKVNLVKPIPNTIADWIQNRTYPIIATVECVDWSCGSVTGIPRYNKTSNEPDTPINITNSTQGDKPFYIFAGYSKHPDSFGPYPGRREPDDPQNACDDGLNDNSTYARFFANTSSEGGTLMEDYEAEIYNFIIPKNQKDAMLSYTWSVDFHSTSDTNANVRIYFYDWIGSKWDKVYEDICTYISCLIPFGTYNLSINSTYINSTGGIKTMFEASAEVGFGGGEVFSDVRLYDVYVSIPKPSCGNMGDGDSCTLKWYVNATGEENSVWKIDVNFVSDSTLVSPNDTEDVIIRILAPNIIIHGMALNYYTGERINGEINFVPLESSYRFSSPIYDGVWTLYAHTDLSNVSHFTLIVEDDKKKGYSEVKIGRSKISTLECSLQNIQLSGYLIDLETNNPINSGTVRVSILETGYVKSSNFSGHWNITMNPCLVPGKIYTLRVLVSDHTGKKGEFIQKYPAK